MKKIVRVGVTFPPELLKQLDEIINEIGYDSRSKAIQDAVNLPVFDIYNLTKWVYSALVRQEFRGYM